MAHHDHLHEDTSCVSGKHIQRLHFKRSNMDIRARETKLEHHRKGNQFSTIVYQSLCLTLPDRWLRWPSLPLVYVLCLAIPLPCFKGLFLALPRQPYHSIFLFLETHFSAGALTLASVCRKRKTNENSEAKLSELRMRFGTVQEEHARLHRFLQHPSWKKKSPQRSDTRLVSRKQIRSSSSQGAPPHLWDGSGRWVVPLN